jgi:hypothetical protein
VVIALIVTPEGLPPPGLKGLPVFSEAKLGLDLQAWINRTAGGPLKGQPPTPGPKTLACGHAAP